MDKAEQRKIVKEKLTFTANDDRKAWSRSIAEIALALPEYQSAASVFIYHSTPYEVDTSAIIMDAVSCGKKVMLPCIVADRMTAVAYTGEDNLVAGRYGVSQPVGSAENNQDIDVIFVPLLAFDDNKNRLGRGGGFYDRFLSKSSAVKVGLAFGLQRLGGVLTNDYDVPLDKIITEEGVL